VIHLVGGRLQLRRWLVDFLERRDIDRDSLTHGTGSMTLTSAAVGNGVIVFEGRIGVWNSLCTISNPVSRDSRSVYIE